MPSLLTEMVIGNPPFVAGPEVENRQAAIASLKAEADRAAIAPKELEEITARIVRLRERLRAGDPDIEPDELQAAIERAEAKKAELEVGRPIRVPDSKVIAMLPKAAELYGRQIKLGLQGAERELAKARVVLREIFNGRIDMRRGPDGSLFAVTSIQPLALLQVVGNDGSGGTLRNNHL